MLQFIAGLIIGLAAGLMAAAVGEHGHPLPPDDGDGCTRLEEDPDGDCQR